MLSTNKLALRSNSQTTSIQGSASASASVTYSLPPAAGSPGQYLQNQDGSGTLVWASAGSITAELLERLKIEQDSSPYAALQPIMFDTDLSTFVDGASTGAFSPINRTFDFAASTAQTFISTQMLDDVFLASGNDIGSVDLTVFWKLANIDTGAVFAISQNGENSWQTITMTRIGTSDTYQGHLDLAEETIFQTLHSPATATTSVNLDASARTMESQKFIVAAPEVVKTVTITPAITNTPEGNFWIAIVLDDGTGKPSTATSAILAETTAQSIITLVDNTPVTVNLAAVLPIGTYHWVVRTDAAYKNHLATYPTHTFGLKVGTGSTANSYNSGTSLWGADSTYAVVMTIAGRVLDLRVRITSSVTAGLKSLVGLGVFFDYQNLGVVQGVMNKYRIDFFAVANNTSTFTMPFLPDADLLMCFHVQKGKVWMYPAFDINGYQVIFPASFFNNGGIEETVTLIFYQPNGSVFDNSDKNAALLALNHLSAPLSADPTAVLNKGVAGRGIYLTRPDGIIREVALDLNDNLVVMDT